MSLVVVMMIHSKAQSAFSCSMLTMETPECVEYDQS